MKWSMEQFNAYEARRLSKSLKSAMKVADAADEPESKLHSQILEQCRMRGWLAFHGSMAHKAKRTLGEPDFTILMDSGNILFIECKRASEKPSQKQLEIHAWAKRLGHTVHVVRSYQEFLNLL